MTNIKKDQGIVTAIVLIVVSLITLKLAYNFDIVEFIRSAVFQNKLSTFGVLIEHLVVYAKAFIAFATSFFKASN